MMERQAIGEIGKQLRTVNTDPEHPLRNIQLDVGQHHLVHGRGRGSAIDDSRAAEWTIPVANELNASQPRRIGAEDRARSVSESGLIEVCANSRAVLSRRRPERGSEGELQDAPPRNRHRDPALRSSAAACSGVWSRCGEPSSSNPTMNLRTAADRSSGG